MKLRDVLDELRHGYRQALAEEAEAHADTARPSSVCQRCGHDETDHGYQVGCVVCSCDSLATTPQRGPCPRCDGTGAATYRVADYMGDREWQAKCEDCNGSGATSQPGPISPARQTDHPYETGDTDACIRCGQVGSYIHSEDYLKACPHGKFRTTTYCPECASPARPVEPPVQYCSICRSPIFLEHAGAGIRDHRAALASQPDIAARPEGRGYFVADTWNDGTPIEQPDIAARPSATEDLETALEAFFAVPRPPATDQEAIVQYELALQRLRIAYGVYAGTLKPCPVRSSITDQPCLLAERHPQDSETRFHRYEAADIAAGAPTE